MNARVCMSLFFLLLTLSFAGCGESLTSEQLIKANQGIEMVKVAKQFAVLEMEDGEAFLLWKTDQRGCWLSYNIRKIGLLRREYTEKEFFARIKSVVDQDDPQNYDLLKRWLNQSRE